MMETEFITVLCDYAGDDLAYKEYLKKFINKNTFHYHNDLNEIFRMSEKYNKAGPFKCKVIRRSEYQP